MRGKQVSKEKKIHEIGVRASEKSNDLNVF